MSSPFSLYKSQNPNAIGPAPKPVKKTMRKSATRNPQPHPNPIRSRVRIRNPGIRFPRKGPIATPAAAAATPQLRWKLSDSDPYRVSGPGKDAVRTGGASARKLAAGIWHSEMHELDVGPSKHDSVNQEPPNGLKLGFNPKKSISHKHQSSAIFLDPSMERATKWDMKCSNPSNEVYQSFDHLKLLIDQQIIQSSTLETTLKADLDRARARISELESKRHSSKKKLEHILRKHAEEKAMWRMREHEKIQSIIDGMRDDLSFERKNRRRAEILNSKLIDEIAEAKKSAKRFLNDYEKEKKARELIEDVCEQLAKEAGEDRVEVQESKMESMRVREELEEERKMLQMAEVWREERVQMKLIDAKLALESQCSQLKKLQSELESFLRSRRHNNFDVEEIKEVELLIEAVSESVKPREIKEFVYHPPPASEDIFSIFEEIQNREEPKEREISASPATDIFLEKPVNGSIGDDSEWETLSGESSSEINEDLIRRKASSNISKLWGSECLDKRENYKIVLSESVPKGRESNVGVNDVGFISPSNLEHWTSPESENPNVARGMKGCIEWPRGVQKTNLKAKLLEARLESSKVQIRHVLKQKI